MFLVFDDLSSFACVRVKMLCGGALTLGLSDVFLSTMLGDEKANRIFILSLLRVCSAHMTGHFLCWPWLCGLDSFSDSTSRCLILLSQVILFQTPLTFDQVTAADFFLLFSTADSSSHEPLPSGWPAASPLHLFFLLSPCSAPLNPMCTSPLPGSLLSCALILCLHPTPFGKILSTYSVKTRWWTQSGGTCHLVVVIC